jgi:mono/diheme cytochrome c family protein
MRLLILLVGCEGVLPGWDWQQMNQQHKFLPFAASPYFADGRAMRTPPEGTIARGAPPPPQQGGTYLTKIPMPLTRELFAQGRRHFETYCATCHGMDGSGESEVARNMDLRKPPSLLKESIRQLPPGRIFEIASEGYGLMPSFAHQLAPRDRWATIAYVQALQRASSVKLDDLPLDVRSEAIVELGR